MAIQFDASLDTRHFTDGAKRIQNSVRQTSEEIKKSGLSLEQYFNNIKSAAAAALAGFSAKQFISQMVQVRGQFQQLEVAFKTMLGSEEKAASLMEQLTKTAAITPFDLQGVTQGAKQLLAYGISADKVNDTLIHLGDIAAGLSLPLNDLVYLYGTTMTQGRMFTQDLRQFQGRGIPIAEELAKVFGTTKDKVGELVTAGKVGAKEFEQAIMAMSSEGGKFAGLMEAQSKTITGQISNIGDAVDSMFNNLGKQSEGVINGTLSVVSSLVENYETVGKVIADLVATYGVYKAAVITVTAIQGLQTAGVGALTAAETVHYGWLVLCEKAQAMLNKTMLANPYVLAATALAGFVAVLVTMKSEQEMVNDAYDEYNRKKDDIIKKEEEHKARIEELCRVAGDESISTNTRRLALIELEQKYPSIFAKYDTEAEKLKHIRDLKAEIAALDGKASITNAGNELENVNRRIAELEKKGGWSLASTNSYAGTHTSSRTRTEEAELLALKKRRDELTKTIRKNESDNYLANLTGVSNEDLKKQIEERRNLIARMDVSGKKYGNVKNGGAAGVYTKDELQGQIQILESEQKKRKQVLEDSTKDFVKEANAVYKKEQAALRKLESLTDPKKRASSKQEIDGKKVSEMSGDEFLEALKKQQTAVDEAKKKVDAYNKARSGGSTSKKATEEAKRQAEAQERMAELLDRQKRDQTRKAIDLQFFTREAEIKAMSDGTDKTIRQIELDYDREIEAIKRSYEDLKIARIEEAKKMYAADPKNKGTNFYESSTFKGTDWDATYTKEEETNRAAQEKAAFKSYVDRLNDEEKANSEAINNYLKQYGDYAQKKQAIYDDANDKICELEEQLSQATTDEAKAAAQARIKIVKEETEKQIEELDIQYGKAKAFMIDLFEDAAEKSVSEIDKIIKKYEALLKFLKGEGDVSRDQLRGFGFSDAEIDKAVKESGTAESIKSITDAIKALKGELAGRSPWQSFTADLSKAVKKIKEAGGDIKEIGSGVQGIGAAVSEFSPQLKQFSSDLANIFDYDDTKIQDAISAVEGLGTTAAGVGQIMSGDVIGGTMSAVHGISQMVDALDGMFGADYSEYNKAREEYDRLSSVWDELIDKKREYLSESWGTEAQAAADEALALLRTEKVANRILAEKRLSSGSSAGSHSIWYRMWQGSYDYKGQNWRDVASEISRDLGVRFTGMGDMLDMTSEQLETIKKDYTGLWTAMDTEFREALENIIIFGKEEAEILEQERERILGTSFESVADEMMNTLYDLADGSKDAMDDIGDNWEKMMNRMVLNNTIRTNLEKDLQKWYDSWYAAWGNDKDIDEAEIERLRKQYDNIKDDYAKQVEALRDSGLVTELSSSRSDKSASAIGLDKISYEQADQIGGQLTAIQIAQGQNGATAQLILTNIETLNSVASATGSAVSEIRSLAIARNEYLLDIKKSNREILNIVIEKMDDMKQVIQDLG